MICDKDKKDVQMNRIVRKLTFGRVPSEDSDQPAHSRSLIRILAMRILDSQGCKVSSRGQWRLWSDCADSQADLSLRWVHMSGYSLTMRLKYSKHNTEMKMSVYTPRNTSYTFVI